MIAANVTCVALGGRGVLIEGPPGSGKSSLALGLIDRGAVLVGDDGVVLEARGARLWAHPPPHIAGKIEIRAVGIATLPAAPAPLCLVLRLDAPVERFPAPACWSAAGCTLPLLAFAMGPDAALRAQWALTLHGLPPDDAAWA